jgi:hypothetical protein
MATSRCGISSPMFPTNCVDVESESDKVALPSTAAKPDEKFCCKPASWTVTASNVGALDSRGTFSGFGSLRPRRRLIARYCK